MSEFDLIKHLSDRNPVCRNDVTLGIGDDCAVLSVPSEYELVVTTDTLIEGVHFPQETCAQAVGFKSLAVNLSDLAAMGAEPAWVTLALSMPEINYEWLDRFALGFFKLAEQYKVELVGGDTTQGPLSITIHAHGLVPKGKAITRSAALVNDFICVTGDLGNAGLELYEQSLHKGTHTDSPNLDYPQPRVNEGIALHGIASAMIDISDGLIADLGHILEASHVGACISLEKIPLSKKLKEYYDQAKVLELALTAGDDYELCFTVPERNINALEKLQKNIAVPISLIGQITSSEGLKILREDGAPIEIQSSGFQHFSGKRHET